MPGDFSEFDTLSAEVELDPKEQELMEQINEKNPAIGEMAAHLMQCWEEAAGKRSQENLLMEWQCQCDQFLGEAYLLLLSEGNFEQVRQEIERLKEEAPPEADPASMDAVLEEVDRISEIIHTINERARQDIKKKKNVSITTVGNETVKGQLIALTEGKKLVVLDEKGKSHNIEFICIRESSFRKLLNAGEYEPGEISYYLGMICFHKNTKWAKEHLQYACEQGCESAKELLECLE